jgi:hypothetical protein
MYLKFASGVCSDRKMSAKRRDRLLRPIARARDIAANDGLADEGRIWLDEFAT